MDSRDHKRLCFNVYPQRAYSQENCKSALQNKKNMLSNYTIFTELIEYIWIKIFSKFRVKILRTFLENRIFKSVDATSASASVYLYKF